MRIVTTSKRCCVLRRNRSGSIVRLHVLGIAWVLVYRSRESPIVDYGHREDGRVAIGLNVEGRQWAQFAYQFVHEFCHALAGHSNQWKEKWIRGTQCESLVGGIIVRVRFVVRVAGDG